MDRPEVLHVRSSPADLQFQSCRLLLIYTLSTPRPDGVKCYDAIDIELFASLLERVDNLKELSMPPLLTTDKHVVIAQFADGKMIAYESIVSYLDSFGVSIMCTDPHCKKPHSKADTQTAAPAVVTEEQLEEMRNIHEDGVKKIVEHYTDYISNRIAAAGLISMYNRVRKLSDNEPVPDDLRREIHNYIKLTSYKCSVVPLRNREDTMRIITTLAVFDEAELDDVKASLSQSLAPAPGLLTFTRVQRRTRDRESVLHYLAFFASLKFDQEFEGCGALRGRGSMYV